MEAVKYIQDNYKDIEKKMKGHKKGENNLFHIIVHQYKAWNWITDWWET